MWYDKYSTIYLIHYTTSQRHLSSPSSLACRIFRRTLWHLLQRRHPEKCWFFETGFNINKGCKFSMFQTGIRRLKQTSSSKSWRKDRNYKGKGLRRCEQYDYTANLACLWLSMKVKVPSHKSLWFGPPWALAKVGASLRGSLEVEGAQLQVQHRAASPATQRGFRASNVLEGNFKTLLDTGKGFLCLHSTPQKSKEKRLSISVDSMTRFALRPSAECPVPLPSPPLLYLHNQWLTDMTICKGKGKGKSDPLKAAWFACWYSGTAVQRVYESGRLKLDSNCNRTTANCCKRFTFEACSSCFMIQLVFMALASLHSRYNMNTLQS